MSSLAKSQPDTDNDALLMAELFIKIRKSSLLGKFSQKDAKQLILKSTRFERCPAGTIVRQSVPSDELVIVADGVLGLCVDDFRGMRETGEAGPGKSVELGTFLGELPKWQYVWQAKTDCCLFRIYGQALRDLLAKSPDYYAYLKRFAASSELFRIAKDLKLVGMNPEHIEHSIMTLEQISGSDLQTLDYYSGLVMIVGEGDVVVNARIGSDLRPVLHLKPGEYSVICQKDIEIVLEPSELSRVWVAPLERFFSRESAEDRTKFEAIADKLTRSLGVLASANDSSGSEFSNDEPEEVEDNGADPDQFLSDPDIVRLRRLSLKRIHVKQHDQMDCGAAVLAMISRYYGVKINIQTFRSLVNVGKSGASLLDLSKGAEKAGFKTCGLFARNMPALRNMHLPFVALMEYHYIVVFQITDTEVVVGDPALSVLRLSHERFLKEFSGNFLALKPTPAFYEQKESPPSYRKYLDIVQGHSPDLLRIFILAILSFVLGLASPVFQQFLFDNVLHAKQTTMVHMFAAGMLCFTVLNQLVSWLQSYLATHFSTVVDAKFNALFLKHVYSLPLPYFLVRRVGDFTTRIGELHKIREFITTKPMILFFQVLSIFLYGSVIAIYNPYILLVVLVFVPLLVALILYVTPKLTELRQISYKLVAAESSASIEQMRNKRIIKALGAEVSARWRWMSKYIDTLAISRETAIKGIGFGVASTFIQQSMGTAILLTGIYFFAKGEMTFGQVMAVTGLSAQVVSPVVSLINEWNHFNEIGVSFGRIDDVITFPTEDTGEFEAVGSEIFQQKIEFKNVSFRYGSETSPLVLDRVSFTINPGESVALVGKSGSGKSTLAYMLNGMYAPTGGAIYVGGTDITKIHPRDLRKSVSMIVQENSLFSGTIMDNISCGSPDATMETIAEAARLADAEEFILRLPNGYSTRLSEEGGGLSGGQKQRINIARALFLNPSVLIMDEATSALDSMSERNIVKNLKTLSRQRTTVIIAHRLNTIVHADRILVLDRGRVVESGRHQDLIAKGGKYAEMFVLQAMG